MFQFKKYSIKNYDFWMVALVLLLSSFGAYFIKIVETEQESLFKSQIMGICMGLFVIAFVSLVDYHFISQFYIILYIFNLGLLLAVKLFGTEIRNTKRWLKFAGVTFQPSELSKIILIIFLAKILTIFKDKLNKIYFPLLTAFLVAIPVYLILDQPNLSTSLVVLFIFVIMIYTAGLSYKIILTALVIIVPIVVGTLWGISHDYDIFYLTSYQQGRIKIYLNPELDSSDLWYQQENSVEVIGSGKLTGKLLTDGKDAIQADTYVPVSESDFIFSVIGEAVGFIGGCGIIILLSIIIFKCLIAAKHAPDLMGRLMATGIAAMFVFQMFVNIGVTTAILPNTGIPLPFVSYGLSSMLSSMISVGIVINISLQRKNKRG